MSTKSARARAAEHFAKAPGADERLQEEREKERQVRAAKNERLRALRVAKEAAEQAAAEQAAAAKARKKVAGNRG